MATKPISRHYYDSAKVENGIVTSWCGKAFVPRTEAARLTTVLDRVTCNCCLAVHAAGVRNSRRYSRRLLLDRDEINALLALRVLLEREPEETGALRRAFTKLGEAMV